MGYVSTSRRWGLLGSIVVRCRVVITCFEDNLLEQHDDAVLDVTTSFSSCRGVQSQPSTAIDSPGPVDGDGGLVVRDGASCRPETALEVPLCSVHSC